MGLVGWVVLVFWFVWCFGVVIVFCFLFLFFVCLGVLVGFCWFGLCVFDFWFV